MMSLRERDHLDGAGEDAQLANQFGAGHPMKNGFPRSPMHTHRLKHFPLFSTCLWESAIRGFMSWDGLVFAG